MKKQILLSALILSFITSCGVYTFNGSSLPAHLKTVNIPTFINQSLEPSVADEITREINKQILSGNLLRIISDQGDATISGTITGYSNSPYTFGASAPREVNVESYIVKISADIEFRDNKNNVSLYKGNLTGEGIYDFQKEDELTGRARAEKDIVQRILQNSVQSW